MTELRTSEVLDLAADEIQRRGWVSASEEGDYGDAWGYHGGPVCLEGAIFAAEGWGEPQVSVCTPTALFETCPGYRAVAEYLGGRYASVTEMFGPERLFTWNDRDGRTEAEVIEVLRAAAAVERAKEESLEKNEVTA